MKDDRRRFLTATVALGLGQIVLPAGGARGDEKEEDRLFGDEGFEKTVEEVAVLEKQLGIYELAQFTPK